MLDLTNRTKSRKLYEVKLPDGTFLTLKLPTQALLVKLQSLQQFSDATSSPFEALDAINDVAVDILNLNTQGITYTRNQIGELLDLDLVVVLVQDYLTETTKTLGE